MSLHSDTLSNRDFIRLCDLIYEKSGIKLNSDKKLMLEGRVKRRIVELELGGYTEYCNYLFASRSGRRRDRDDEIVHLIDVVTTNKTDFFREKAHFEFLIAKVLPALAASHGTAREYLIWSAGCSTGEEAYTLAMILNEYSRSHAGFRFRILATDISTDVLAKAALGIFQDETVRAVPPALQRKYFMRGRDSRSGMFRVVPELRGLIEFRRLNLVEPFSFPEVADAIFCRNVIIYFDRPTQERVFQQLTSRLADGGYIFVGHSESLHRMDLPLAPVGPALYRKTHGTGRE